jgi:outer membrane protein OmpA-like peptidoglycan-associated protein
MVVPFFLVAGGLSIGVASAPAGAAGTNLLAETFANGTTSNADWVLPTGSAGVCLTAGTNTSSTPLPDCDGTYQSVSEPIDANGGGALQLTNNGNGQVGTVYNGVAIPTANGLDISWTSFQFNGSGADGISFDLAAVNPADPTSPSTTGPSGGSLGYAADGGTPGVPYGYLGLGADVYGNYENSTFSGSGCSQSNPAQSESLGVRGPGNGTTGYCLLAKQQLTGPLTLDDSAATSRGSGSTSVGVPEEVVLNPSSSAIIASSSGVSVPAGDWLFAVKPLASNKAGTTWKTLEGALPTNPTGVPGSWLNGTTGLPQELAFGWAASTGGSNEFHQINQLQVSSLTASPSLALTNTDNGGGVLATSSSANVTLTPSVPTSSAVGESQPIIVSDTFSSSLVPTAASGTGWTCSVASPKISCQYTPTSQIAAGTALPPITVTASASGTPGTFSDTATATSQDAAPATATDSGSIRGTQSVTFTSTVPTSALVGGTYGVTATATSGLTPAITVDASSSPVCSISGGTVTFHEGGVCTLDANQSGNSSYSAATQVQQSFAVAKHPQTVSFTSTPPVVGVGSYTPTASATSLLTPVITLDGSSTGCTLNAGLVTFTTGGVCVLDANQDGSFTYSAATQVQQSIIVAESQTVHFTSLAPAAAQDGVGSYTPTASATSGLTPVITLDGSSTGCSLSGGVVTFTAATGTCVLDANQPGGAFEGQTFLAASQVQQSFAIQPPDAVSFSSLAPGSALNGGTYNATATSSSDLTVTFTAATSSSGVCTVTSGGAVTFVGAGICTLDATDGVVTSDQSFIVADTQTIALASSAPGSASVGGTYNVTATATSLLPVTFTAAASSSGVCTVTSGGAVSFTGGGICTLDANQVGGVNGDSLTYIAAQQVQQTFAVAEIPQTVTFTSSPATTNVINGTYDVTATATSGLTPAITVDASSSSVCTISGATVTFNKGGVCALDANQAGNTSYAEATQVQQAFAVVKTPQTIAFTSSVPTSIGVGGATYTPTTSASSSLAVTISVDASSSSVCSISAGAVSFTASGVCTLDANQSGDPTYAAAPQVQQAFVVAGIAQFITFTSTAPSSIQVGGTYNVAASSTSNLPVTISVDPSSSSVCTISGATVTITGDGLCLLDANQAGNSTYPPATQSTQAFEVASPSTGPTVAQSISFTSTPPSANKVGGTYNATALSTSGNDVTISVDPSSSAVCSISGGSVTFIANGTCTIDANQAGDSIYLPAVQVSQSINVGGLLPQKIVFTSTKPSKPHAGSTYRPTATGGGSKKPVTFSVGTGSTSSCSFNASTGMVTFKSSTGTCEIDANQVGSSTYEAAPEVVQIVEMGGTSPLALTIYFANNSWVLSASSKSQLHTLAVGVRAHGLTSLTITGYASSTGGSSNNNVLGIHRANSTATYLKGLLAQLGVKKMSISVSGKGASNFVTYPSTNADNRRTNIRAS